MKLRHLIYSVSTLVIIFSVIISCTNSQSVSQEGARTEYYRNLLFSETSYDFERGTYPLTKDEAGTVNSYKFTYDSLGRLHSIEYVRNDVLLNYGGIRGAAKIVYTYEDGKQLKHFYNSDNKPTTVDGNVYTWEYTVNAQGLRTGLKFYDSTGAPVENRNNIHSYVWSRLPDGLIKENRYTLNGEETVMSEFCPFYELRFTYDDNGHVTRMANYQGDTLYNCTAENCGDIGVSYFAFTNNEHGDVLSFSVHNTIGNLSNLYWGWAKRVTEVNENGYVVKTEVYDQDDEPVGGNQIPVTKNEYNENGSIIQTVNMDETGNVINNPANGIAYTVYAYDESGLRTGTQYFDKDMEPVVPENTFPM